MAPGEFSCCSFTCLHSPQISTNSSIFWMMWKSPFVRGIIFIQPASLRIHAQMNSWCPEGQKGSNTHLVAIDGLQKLSVVQMQVNWQDRWRFSLWHVFFSGWERQQDQQESLILHVEIQTNSILWGLEGWPTLPHSALWRSMAKTTSFKWSHLMANQFNRSITPLHTLFSQVSFQSLRSNRW